MGDLLRLQPARPAQPAKAPEPVREIAPLWREAVGAELRRARHDVERTLGDVAGRAGISTPYLSEVERGLKEPSSEVLEAVAGALELRLVDLTYRVTRQLAVSARSRSIAADAPAGPLALAL